MKTFGANLATLLAGERNLTRDVMPFVRYMLLLLSIVLVYSWLFHVIMAREGQDFSWFTGLYWTLTVMTTLGFGDITFTSDLGRAFSTVVLLTGLVMLLILLPFLFIRAVYGPWLEQRNRARLRALRMLPAHVSGHVLICTTDPIALALVRRLALAGIPAYVIEPDADAALRMRDAGLPVLNGEVDAVDTYTAARAERAALVFANSSDPENSNIILTVRARSEAVPIAALAESEDSIDVLELSGCTHVLPLKHRLGEHLANRVSAGLTRANIIGRFHGLLLAEFPVHDTPLQGKTIRDSGLRDELGLTVVGVWEHGVLLPVRPDLVLEPTRVPVVIGTAEQIAELDEILIIYNTNTNPVIVLGGGKVGRSAAAALKARGLSVHIVEKNPALRAQVECIPDRMICGDAADRQVLEDAGITKAPSILITTHDDAMNVYLTVYCRRLNPEARILSRVTHERNVQAIQRAGADFVLSYASLGVHTVLSLVQKRELVVLGEGVDLFHVPVPRTLVGKTIVQADISARTGLTVIAVQDANDAVHTATSDEALRLGTALVAIGSPAARERFDVVYR